MVIVKPVMNLRNSGGMEELQSQMLCANLQKIPFEISRVPFMPVRIKRFSLEAFEIFCVSHISTVMKAVSLFAKHGFPSDLRNSCAPNLFRVKPIWLISTSLENIAKWDNSLC